MMNANDSKIFTVSDVKDAIEDATNSEVRTFPSYFNENWKYNNFLSLKKNFKDLYNSLKLQVLFDKNKNNLHIDDKSQFEIFLNIKEQSIKIFLNQGGYFNIPIDFPDTSDPIEFCFDTLIYTTKYDTFLKVFEKGFHKCKKFNFQDILEAFNQYVFPELLTKLNYLSISDHPITESLITTANQREFTIKSSKITYKEKDDFLDLKTLKNPNYWSEEPFAFYEEGKIDKDGSGIFLPINFISAEDIVNAVLNPKRIVNNKTKNYIVTRNYYGSDYYLLDFSDYRDKEYLLQLIQQEDIIDLFPYFEPIQQATDKFVRHIAGFPTQFSLNYLNKDFHPVYEFTKTKFDKGEDLSFVIYILCERIATILEDDIVGKRLFLQQMWKFLTEFLDIKTVAQKVFTKNCWNNIIKDKKICTTAIIDLDKPLTIQDLGISKFYYNTRVEGLDLLDDWREQNYQIVDMNVIKNQLNQMFDDEELKQEILKIVEQIYVYTVQDFRDNAIVRAKCKIDGHHCEFLIKIK